MLFTPKCEKCDCWRCTCNFIPWELHRDFVYGRYAEGFSYTQIAQELSSRLGRIISRDAVAGKLFRDKKLTRRLTGPRPRKPKPLFVPAARDTECTREVAVTKPIELVQASPIGIIRGIHVLDGISNGVGIQQLKASSCRWPLGNPRSADFHFCAEPKRAKSSYCADHHKIAWRPAVKRRKLNAYFKARTWD